MAKSFTNRRKELESKRITHYKYLTKMGLNPEQIRQKKLLLGSEWNYELKVKENIPLSNNIPANGTKPLDERQRIKLSSKYPIAPLYNKGPYGVVSRSEIKYIGKK